MALFDDDNQFAGFEEEEETVSLTEAEGEEGEAAPPPASNRNFKLGLFILGGIILLGIAVVVVISLLGGNSGETATRQAEAARIDAANTATMRAATDIAASEEAARATAREINRMTLNAPTNTPTPVVSFPTETPQPTATKPQQTPNATQVELTRQAGEKGGPEPTYTATLSAGAAQTATAMAATGEMPGTGFADEVGLPLMVGLAALLLVVIFVSRRLRTAA